MLNKNDAVATIAVKNIDVARKSYEGVLRLTPEPEVEEGVLPFKTGGSRTRTATSSRWPRARRSRERKGWTVIPSAARNPCYPW